ncbi:MAG: group I truncated hemoglobin [Brachymonas sp.]
MKKILLALITVTSLSALPALADDSLYQAFGGKAGMAALMDEFHKDLMADKRMQPFFEKTKAAQFKDSLGNQLCQVSGGPCQYKGPDMNTAHGQMDINKAHFNALVEVLQKSMATRGIPFAAQNRMLGLLAPMHRDIINVK